MSPAALMGNLGANIVEAREPRNEGSVCRLCRNLFHKEKFFNERG